MERHDQVTYRLGLRLRQAVVTMEQAEVAEDPAGVPAARTALTRLTLAHQEWAGGADLGVIGCNLVANLAAVSRVLASQSAGEDAVESGAAHLESFRQSVTAWLSAKCLPPSRAAEWFVLGWTTAGIFEDEVEDPPTVDSLSGSSAWVQEPGSAWVWPRDAVALAANLGVSQTTLFPFGGWSGDKVAMAFWESLPPTLYRSAWAVLERGLRRLAELPPPAKLSRCQERDQMFLAWYDANSQETYRSPTAIMSKWNNLHPAQKVLSTETVRKAIQRARKRIEPAVSRSPSAQAATSS